MKIVLLDAETLGDVPNLNKIGSLGEFTSYKNSTPEEALQRTKDADVVISNKVQIDQRLIENANNLKLICIAATGLNNVDLEFAKQRGIPVKNVVDYSTESVAQHTFSLILYLLHHLSYYDKYVKSGTYSANPLFTHHEKPFWQLSGKRFGIIGMGNIGRRVAEIAKVFGCDIVYYSTSGNNKGQEFTHLELSELLKTSDIVSIHAPLNDRTKNLIDYDQIKMMKPSSLLINNGRGAIINEPALARALNEGLIAGAALDVMEKEPLPANSPLLKINDPEKLLITPHIAWASIEARTTLIDKIADNIAQVFE